VFDSEVRPTEVGPSLFDLCARVNGPRRRESRAKRVARSPDWAQRNPGQARGWKAFRVFCFAQRGLRWRGARHALVRGRRGRVPCRANSQV